MSHGAHLTGGSGRQTRKQKYSMEDWEERLAQKNIPKSILNDLVMNYLVIEGYKDAAECFREESGAEPSVDLESIAGRMATRVALQNGDVEEAMSLANALNPLVLEENRALYFHLQQQKLIELIREGRVEEALTFAQDELAPKGEENKEFLRELERTMTLLAFEDVTKSPMSDLLSPAQRQKTASELNAAILSSQSQEKDPKLPSLLKLLSWAQDQLAQQAEFPRMNFGTGELEDPSASSAPPSSS